MGHNNTQQKQKEIHEPQQDTIIHNRNRKKFMNHNRTQQYTIETERNHEPQQDTIVHIRNRKKFMNHNSKHEYTIETQNKFINYNRTRIQKDSK